MPPLNDRDEDTPEPRTRTARARVRDLPAATLGRLKVWAEIIAVVGTVGGGALWLVLPRINAHADERATSVVERIDAPIAPALKAASDAATAAAGEAQSANALAQQQIELVGALACLQAGGTLAVDECAFRGARGAPPITVTLKNVKGLVAAMAVKGR